MAEEKTVSALELYDLVIWDQFLDSANYSTEPTHTFSITARSRYADPQKPLHLGGDPIPMEHVEIVISSEKEGGLTAPLRNYADFGRIEICVADVTLSGFVDLLKERDGSDRVILSVIAYPNDIGDGSLPRLRLELNSLTVSHHFRAPLISFPAEHLKQLESLAIHSKRVEGLVWVIVIMVGLVCIKILL